MFLIIFFSYTAQPCVAADAAGAAFGLGAIFAGRAVPPAVPVQTPASGAAERWRSAASSNPYRFSFIDFGGMIAKEAGQTVRGD